MFLFLATMSASWFGCQPHRIEPMVVRLRRFCAWSCEPAGLQEISVAPRR